MDLLWSLYLDNYTLVLSIKDTGDTLCIGVSMEVISRVEENWETSHTLPLIQLCLYGPLQHVAIVLWFLQSNIRALSLRALIEILKQQSERFQDYAELTILKVQRNHSSNPHGTVLSTFSYGCCC